MQILKKQYSRFGNGGKGIATRKRVADGGDPQVSEGSVGGWEI
jgi:hypothetical protein